MTMKNTKLFIITGMSGAGKSQALKCFEDFGYFCIDNLPVNLFRHFLGIIHKKKYLSRVAIGVDIREGRFFGDFSKQVRFLRKKGIDLKVIFLDASDHILIQRFSETRHRHPLGKNTEKAVREERKILLDLKSQANRVIDTSKLALGELKETVSHALEIKQSSEMKLNIISFGYKHGLPLDADIVMDVRFLPNPNYVSGLRDKTGMDESVKKFLERKKILKVFLDRYSELIKELLPMYIKEGKSYLTVAIGCTGGRHRSVYVAGRLSEILSGSGFPASTYHRDARKR